MARPINISVPDHLYVDVKKYTQIQISTVCQTALQEAVNEHRKKLDLHKINLGAKRLMEQMGEIPKTSVSDYEEGCYEDGQNWAAQEATIEELEKIFADSGKALDLYEVFFDQCLSIPKEIMEEDEDDNQLFFAFHDGARDMWWEMKKILEEKGYEI